MAKPTQRYACDRCHGQKLRCIHTASGPCVRCAKAKATCSWSQSLRSRRPDSNFPIGRIDQHAPLPDTTPIVNYPLDLFTSQTPSSNIRSELDLGPSQIQFPVSPGVAPPEVTVRYPSPASQEPPNNYNYTPQSSDGGPDIITDSMNWLGPADANGITQDASQVCWQHLFNQEWALLSSQPAVNGSSNPVIDDAGNTPKTPCLLPIIRQLSELNVELYAHSIVIPKPPESLSEPVSWRNKDFAIDRTFQLSQRLIEITNKKYPLYLETASTDISNASSINTLQSSGLQPDQGFCLLILSCYTRLVDTYDRIFANMQACLDRSSVTAREDYVNLPSVQVGSFSLPQSSATQIVLILQLARHLLGRMGEIIKAIGLDKQHNNRDAENDDLITECTTGPEKLLLMSALDTVRPQEDCLMKRITKLRTTLIELNIL